MIVAQCDWCKRIQPSQSMPAGWVMLAVADGSVPGLFSPGMKSEAMLCSWVCLAEWAAARALLKEVPDE